MVKEHYTQSDSIVAWRTPDEFNLRNKSDQSILEQYFDDGKISVVHDQIKLIADNLYKLNFPDKLDDETEKASYTSEILGQSEKYGRWFYFPWSRELVHYPTPDDHRKLRTSRNRNLITEEEQRKLYAATLAIFGMSVGSHVVESVVLSGIGGKLVLADSDIIEPPNLNRMNADFTDVGTSKVEYIAKQVSKIDPYIVQVIINNNITKDSLSELVERHKPQIIFDEVDNLSIKASIRLQARDSKIATVMATDLGDKSLIDVERYDVKKHKKAKPFNGRLKLKEVKSLASEDEADIAKEALAKIIGIRNVTPRLLSSFMEQQVTLSGLPQLGSTAIMGGALAAVAAREIILGRPLKSGRYIAAAKDILRLKSPTPFLEGLKTLNSFVKYSKA